MDYKAAASLLGSWDNILILTHKRPDGDTIGCAVGLCALLRQCGKTAWVLDNPDATEHFIPYLEGYVAPKDFAYANTTAHAHAVAAALLERDIPYRAINKAHFRTKSMARMGLEGALLEHMEVLEGGKIVLSAVTLADMARLNAREEDAEDIAAFLGQIEGVKVSATVRELAGGECKISLRTDPDYLNATDTCALLGGGGHKAASGCTVMGTAQEAQEAMKNAILKVLHGD